MEVVLSHRPPLWPRRSGLRTGRLTKASEAAGRKTRCKKWPHAARRADDGQSSTQDPTRISSLKVWTGVRRCKGESVVPTPPHLGHSTKGPPARPEWVAGEWRQTVAKRPPVILRPPWFDPDWQGQWGGLMSSSPASSSDHRPPGKKSSSSTCPGPTTALFPLICFAQLNFRGHPATSFCKDHDPEGRG